jgi:hypothetical protein
MDVRTPLAAAAGRSDNGCQGSLGPGEAPTAGDAYLAADVGRVKENDE